MTSLSYSVRTVPPSVGKATERGTGWGIVVRASPVMECPAAAVIAFPLAMLLARNGKFPLHVAARIGTSVMMTETKSEIPNPR